MQTRHTIHGFIVRLEREPGARRLSVRPVAHNAGSVARLLRRYVGERDREVFVVVLLTQRRRIIGLNTVSIGSLRRAIADPREVFKPAILAGAAAVMVGHNHPSGDVEPSREDLATTRRLVDAGRLLDIPVLDHLIVGEGAAYFSFHEQHLLSTPNERA
jgi:DNA repair protein RadC